MARRPTLSKPLRTSLAFFEKYKGGMTFRDIEILTGWSRATLRRRMTDDDFPNPLAIRGCQKRYDVHETLEWLSRYNLQLLLRDKFLDYERTLQARSFADPLLLKPRWRIIDREIMRRKREFDELSAR